MFDIIHYLIVCRVRGGSSSGTTTIDDPTLSVIDGLLLQRLDALSMINVDDTLSVTQ